MAGHDPHSVEPIQEEPRTPGWLPLLGLALGLAALAWIALSTTGGGQPEPAVGGSAAAADSAAP